MIDRWLEPRPEEEDCPLGPLNFALTEEEWDESEYDSEKADKIDDDLDDEEWAPESEF